MLASKNSGQRVRKFHPVASFITGWIEKIVAKIVAIGQYSILASKSVISNNSGQDSGQMATIAQNRIVDTGQHIYMLAVGHYFFELFV